MNIKRESTLERSHLWYDTLISLVCYVVLLCLLTFPNTTQAQAEQTDRGVSAKLKESEQKFALVIGNADYDISAGKLKNPINDATDMAAALTRLGFKLVNGKPNLNVDKRQMLDLIREFGNQIRNSGVGVFYFAGHGVQIDKHNYLIPITDSLQYQEDAEFEAVDVDRILRQMEDAGNAFNILILDACRNNNLPKKTRNTESGLGEPQRKPSGVFIAFAARDGQAASENPSGRNGLYTQELLKYLEIPNTRLEDIFINTRREVKRLSNKTQEPIEYGSIDHVFYFKVNENAAIQSQPKPTSTILVETEKQFQDIRKYVDVRTNKYRYMIGEDLEFMIINSGDKDIIFHDDPLCRWGLQIEESGNWKNVYHIGKGNCNIATNGADIRLSANGGIYSQIMGGSGKQGNILQSNKKYRFVFWYSSGETNLPITEPLATNWFIITDNKTTDSRPITEEKSKDVGSIAGTIWLIDWSIGKGSPWFIEFLPKGLVILHLGLNDNTSEPTPGMEWFQTDNILHVISYEDDTKNIAMRYEGQIKGNQVEGTSYWVKTKSKGPWKLTKVIK